VRAVDGILAVDDVDVLVRVIHETVEQVSSHLGVGRFRHKVAKDVARVADHHLDNVEVATLSLFLALQEVERAPPVLARGLPTEILDTKGSVVGIDAPLDARQCNVRHVNHHPMVAVEFIAHVRWNISHGAVHLPRGRDATTWKVERVSRRLSSIHTAHELIIVRVMDIPGENPP